MTKKNKTETVREVRIADGIILSDAVVDASKSDGPEVPWYTVAIPGKWEGHWMGAFSLNAAMFDQMVEYFHSLKNDTVVDYEHGTLGMGPDGRAAGWITNLKRDGENLAAQILWTTPARDAIAKKEYRYMSPTVVFNTRDRKTGEIGGASLHSVALTNTPFLDELPEVRLNSLREFLGNKQNPEDQEMLTKEQFAALATTLTLPAEIEADALIAKISGMQTEQVALTAKMTELEKTIQALSTEKKEIVRDALIAEAKREGKIVPENEAWAKDLAEKDATLFKAWSATTKPIVPVTTVPVPNTQGAGGDFGLTEHQKKICVAMGHSFESYAKELNRSK